MRYTQVTPEHRLEICDMIRDADLVRADHESVRFMVTKMQITRKGLVRISRIVAPLDRDQ